MVKSGGLRDPAKEVDLVQHDHGRPDYNLPSNVAWATALIDLEVPFLGYQGTTKEQRQ